MNHHEKLEKKTTNFDQQLYELFEFRARKGDLKKFEIIQAAIECLTTLGLENTTYEALAQKIGTRRAHIAYHFRDKNDIFIAAVKYTLATFQQITFDSIDTDSSGREMLFQYLESTFEWAITHPRQVAIMLLLYYQAQLHPHYRVLHHKIRHGGHERLKYILQKKFNPPYSAPKAAMLAKTIQNIASGFMLDSVTTENCSLEKAKGEALKVIQTLLKSTTP